MGEPVGIGTGTAKHTCAGNPNRPGAVLNDCPKEARWVVVAPMVIMAGGEPAVALIAACDTHLLGIKAWMRDRAEEAAIAMGEEFTADDEPMVDSIANLGKLEAHFGDSAWIASA